MSDLLTLDQELQALECDAPPFPAIAWPSTGLGFLHPAPSSSVENPFKLTEAGSVDSPPAPTPSSLANGRHLNSAALPNQTRIAALVKSLNPVSLLSAAPSPAPSSAAGSEGTKDEIGSKEVDEGDLGKEPEEVWWESLRGIGGLGSGLPGNLWNKGAADISRRKGKGKAKSRAEQSSARTAKAEGKLGKIGRQASSTKKEKKGKKEMGLARTMKKNVETLEEIKRLHGHLAVAAKAGEGIVRNVRLRTCAT
jgi:hypothetical protein